MYGLLRVRVLGTGAFDRPVQLDPTIKFELGYFDFPVISNSKLFPMDLPFSHLPAAISNSRYFELFFVSPESSI